ncbi:MAG: hypothetical protein ACM3SW_07970 [Actinomycetota bacterium]
MNKKRLFAGGLAAGAGIAGMIILILYLINAPARAAAQNLAAINGITVGRTTEADLLRRPQFQTLPRKCFGAACDYGMGVDNSFLSRLHLARPTSLWTIVEVSDGMVTRVSVIGWVRGRPGVSLSQVNQVTDCDYSPCVKALITPNHVMQSTRISFTSQSDIRNHIPEAVDVRCFSRIHGCDTVEEMMPLMRGLSAKAAKP